MEIQYENIVLRDMIETDIEDYVRWFTQETAWSEYDAPWEAIETDEAEERQSWREYYESVKQLPDDLFRWKFEIEYEGRHIGWVSAYSIDENYQWISAKNIKDGQTIYHAVGIDICESNIWGSGIGTNALRAFLEYCAEHGWDELYTQTWSGNGRMIRVAKKLGFVEWSRAVGTREVDGARYDGLTFKWEKKIR
ncbi:MAG: GNAT family N-acetyltransferase [Lachnospiraceae bacterium]|jgi:RimJ/RimL family protein N-acetyltransferase|nr:GNAT family N-acetyltransferase [Lachnospiraceae bacterium]